MAKFLGETGLMYLWGKIKDRIAAQFAFGKVKVTNNNVSSTVEADSVIDTLEMVAGSNITLTADTANDKVTIAASVPGATSTTPNMDGTAAVGSETTWAKGDHVHPTDTTRHPLIDSSHKLSADLVGDGTTNHVFTADDDTKLTGIATGAEVNQNAFSKVQIVGDRDTIDASGKTDTLTVTAPVNSLISLTKDTTNGKRELIFDVDKDLSKYDNTTSQFITAADVPEGAAAYTSNPEMDGTASPGTSNLYAKGDHVHPTDTSRAAATHTHGNIQSGGTLQTTDVAIANGDKLVVTDSSDSSKVARTSLSFDGSTATKALTKKGTWEDFDLPPLVIPTNTLLQMQSGTYNDIATALANGREVSVQVVNGQVTSIYNLSDIAENVYYFTASNAEDRTIYTISIYSDDEAEMYTTPLALDDHTHGNITNDGKVTATGVGLANNDTLLIVDASDSSKIKQTSIKFDGSTTTKALTQKGTWETFLNSTNVGVASGICPLDSNAKIDASYLPSYVDDVVEAYIRSGQTALSSTWLATGSASGTAITPETGKIYVLMNSDSTYPENTEFRWGGSTYVKINDGGISAMTTAEMDTATDNWT